MGALDVALLWLYRVWGLTVLSGAVLVVGSEAMLGAAIAVYAAGLAGWALVDSALSMYLAGVALFYFPMVLAVMPLDTARFSNLLSRLLLTLTLAVAAGYAVWAYTGHEALVLAAMATILHLGLTKPAMRIARRASQMLDRFWDPALDVKALEG